MRKEKQRAFELRKSGKSYNYISDYLQIPKSTLSSWFSSSFWSRDIKKRLAAEAFKRVEIKFRRMTLKNIKRWALWRKIAREEAIKEFPKYRKNILFCSGVMLYWGEGDKNPKNPVRISNIDPNLLKTFVAFLKKFGKIAREKIRPHIILYPDLNESNCKTYWVKKLSIPEHQFYKTQFIVGRHKTKRLHQGIGVVTVGSRQLKEKILKWIELYSKI